MARSGRVVSETGIYHILLRGTNVLFPEDTDFVAFLKLLKKYVDSGSLKIFAYTLLKNRVHLVCGARDSIGRSIKPLCTSYARYINRTYSKGGKLFYDRMKSEPINSAEELQNAVAFVNYLGKNIDCADKYLAIIREQLEEMIVGLNNPFATEIIRTLSEVIRKMPRKVSKIQKGITKGNSGTLGIATKGINGYNI